VAYRLALLQDSKIHPIFYVSMFKKFKGDSSIQYIPLLLITTIEGHVLQPAKVLAGYENNSPRFY